MNCRVEGTGNREVPPDVLLGRAEANLEGEGGSRGKHDFPLATEPKAEEAA
jgi:hypothetical protein